ncbi:MerR family DNA-binding protein [Streptomyces lavendulae]|uniref:MerR family DNA-binding protein n=1 Tax=Streptomyces lavendulae TaxID=1914 RepID=UPI0036CD37A4
MERATCRHWSSSPRTRSSFAYHEEDLEWLAICTKLRSSGMSLAVIRQYIELARQGPGNEHERLQLLRRHEAQVETQIRALQDTLDVMRYKVQIYEKHLARGEADRLWNPSYSHAGQSEPDQERHPPAST